MAGVVYSVASLSVSPLELMAPNISIMFEIIWGMMNIFTQMSMIKNTKPRYRVNFQVKFISVHDCI